MLPVSAELQNLKAIEVVVASLSSNLPGPNPLSGRESAHEPPSIAEAGSLPHAPQAMPAPMSGGRLAAIAQGQSVPTETHAAVAKEEPVLEIGQFNLWYGAKQALHNISMAIPRNKVTALVGPSGCGKSTLAAKRESVERFAYASAD